MEMRRATGADGRRLGDPSVSGESGGTALGVGRGEEPRTGAVARAGPTLEDGAADGAEDGADGRIAVLLEAAEVARAVQVGEGGQEVSAARPLGEVPQQVARSPADAREQPVHGLAGADEVHAAVRGRTEHRGLVAESG